MNDNFTFKELDNGDLLVTEKHITKKSIGKTIEEIRNNPNVTNKQLSIIIGILETAIENNIRILRENKIIERIGSKKTGFWKIIE